MSKAKSDPVFDKAKAKIGEAIDACKPEELDKIIKLCDTLAKMKIAESKGKADPDDWGSGLK